MVSHIKQLAARTTITESRAVDLCLMISQFTVRREVLKRGGGNLSKSSAVSLSGGGRRVQNLRKTKLYRYAERNLEPLAEYTWEEKTEPKEKKKKPRMEQVEKSKDLTWNNGNSGRITVSRASCTVG